MVKVVPLDKHRREKHGEKKKTSNSEALQLYFDRRDTVDKMLKAEVVIRSNAINQAISNVLGDDKKGIDKDQLHGNKDLAGRLAEKIVESYMDHISQKLKMPKEELAPYKDMVLQWQKGSTEESLQRAIYNLGRDFSYESLTASNDFKIFLEGLKKNLVGVAGAHLGDEHIDDILQYVVSKHPGVKDIIDRDKLNVEHAKHLLEEIRAHGKIRVKYNPEKDRFEGKYVDVLRQLQYEYILKKPKPQAEKKREYNSLDKAA